MRHLGRRRWWPAWLAAGFVAALSSCSLLGESPDGQMAFVPAVERVEVSGFGAEPRHVLRYGLTKGDTFDILATDQVRVHQRLVPESGPASAADLEATGAPEVAVEATIATTARADVIDSEPVGEATMFVVETEVSGVEVVRASLPDVAESLSELRQESGDAVVRRLDDRGRSYGDGEQLLSGTRNPIVAEPAGGDVANLAGGETVVFPEEPVGEGATWQIQRHMVVDGRSVEQVVDVVLDELMIGEAGVPGQVRLHVTGTNQAGEEADNSRFSGLLTVDLNTPFGVGEITSSAVHSADVAGETGWRMIEQTTEVMTEIEILTDG